MWMETGNDCEEDEREKWKIFLKKSIFFGSDKFNFHFDLHTVDGFGFNYIMNYYY